MCNDVGCSQLEGKGQRERLQIALLRNWVMKGAEKWDSHSKEVWKGSFETFFKKCSRLLAYLLIYFRISCEGNKKKME